MQAIKIISIHAPREGSDGGAAGRDKKGRLISIHAPREGSDLDAEETIIAHQVFLSTLPARGATVHFCDIIKASRISIHAPREGSDLGSQLAVSIRWKFLSTLPARGATLTRLGRASTKPYFYPRSPRGERQGLPGVVVGHGHISIHAPREGSDSMAPAYRPPSAISIHAPREGSDAAHGGTSVTDGIFLSTLPARGATLIASSALPARTAFLSTLPARGATTCSSSSSP